MASGAPGRLREHPALAIDNNNNRDINFMAGGPLRRVCIKCVEIMCTWEGCFGISWDLAESVDVTALLM